ncbi:MAG: peptide chain release factor 1 [Candidatus Omnitrophota bacterium]
MVDYNKLKQEYNKLSEELSSQEIYKDKERYQIVAKRFSFLEKVNQMLNLRDKLIKEKASLLYAADDTSEDKEVREFAKEEILKLSERIAKIENDVEDKIFEEEDEPDRDVIIEIRAAAGGEEAALFAANLFKMYVKYIEKRGWQKEVLSSHNTEIGGVKEIVFSVKGAGCYSRLKFESGVHRVQRVPITESGGRIHTSTATVAMLIEPKSVEVEINPQDLRIDTFRASGAGGQHVNRTDSAVRITHLPTGIIISCQDERSQIKNREKAMRVLRARILDKKEREEQQKVSKARKIQVGSGERSEKIRTYNFPERRVTEHRINLTSYRLESILEGDMDEIIDTLIKEERRRIYEAKELNKDQ